MNGAIQFSDCSNAGSAMKQVLAGEFRILASNSDPNLGFMPVSLKGEPEMIGLADVGNPIDFILAHYGQEAASPKGSNWEYYKSDLAYPVGSSMKAWLHWNGECFDMYLKCAQSTDGSTGFASHAMPCIQR